MVVGVHRLHAAAGAQVEQRADGRGGHRPQQRHRRLPNAGDIGTLVEAGGSAGVEVGDHPSAACAGVQRAHIQRRPHDRPVGLDQARGDRRRQRKGGQRRCHLSGRAGITEEEQPNQGGKLAAAANGASDRYHLVTSQGRVRVGTEQREDNSGKGSDDED